MRILVAGGAGFVGSNLIRHLLQEYPAYTVTLVDNFVSETNDNIEGLADRKNLEIVEVNIADSQPINQLLRRIEPSIIINTTHTRKEEKNVETFSIGSFNLLQQARKHLPSLKNYLYLSSDEIYGEVVSENGNLRPGLETDPLKPQTPRSALQAGADLLTTSFYFKYGLPTTVLRTSNLFGPYQKTNRLIPTLIRQALQNKDIPVYGEGTHSRDWLYVQDLVNLIDKIIHADAEKREGKVFNAAGSKEYTVLEVTELILTIADKPKELISFLPDQKPEIDRRLIDSSKARQVFDWQPEVDIKESLSQTIDWYQSVNQVAF